MIALQRLAYGPLRVIEVEQLYEKAWFAITETCLAMTIFREEVGGWFLVMFVSLLIGKVWGWLGEGRLEILEQQPPSNPRLFHLRLSFSLALAVLFDLFMLKYSVQTIREQAEPNMMVMFAFEFAVLSVTSLSSAAKYAIFVHEGAVIKEQARVRRQERLERNQREAVTSAETPLSGNNTRALLSNVEHDENEDVEDEGIDVPGWESKGFWVFYLDLLTGMPKLVTIRPCAKSIYSDFLKLVLYLSFFSVLCIFYGMPLHIIRDVAITIHSFYKRIHDFLRYRQATEGMNERYADATSEEMAREDVCIICREIMTAWTDNSGTRGADQATLRQQDQRLRPKKLPCGHILHFACLRSWLERQQNCPTCRRPVLSTTSLVRSTHNQAQPQPNHPDVPVAREGFPPNRNDDQPQQRQNRVRVFNFGPIRLGIGAGPDLRGLADQINRNERRLPRNRPSNTSHIVSNNLVAQQGATVAHINSSPDSIQRQIQVIEQQLMQQISSLQVQADQLYLVRTLQGELARIRMYSQDSATRQYTSGSSGNRPFMGTTQAPAAAFQPVEVVTSDSQNLPNGITLPEGWTLMPLRRVADGQVDLSNTLATNGPSQSSEPLPRRAPNIQVGGHVDTGARVSGDNSIFSGEYHEVRPAMPSAAPNGEVSHLVPGARPDESSATERLRTFSRSNAEQIATAMNAPASSQTGLMDFDHDVIADDVGMARSKGTGTLAKGKHVTVEDHEDDST